MKMNNVYLFIIVILVAGCDGRDGNDSSSTISDNSSVPELAYELIYIDNSAVQCESPGLTEKETAQILIDNDIDVINSKCGYLSDIAVAALCGLGDTKINLHKITSQNLQDAKALGYEPVSTLKNGDNVGYEVIDCPE